MISASLQQRKTRTRRSMLFVPGANAAMVSNSFIPALPWEDCQ